MTPLVQQTTNFLSYLVVLADIFAVILFVVLVTPLRKRGGKKFVEFFGRNAILFSFLITLGSLLGSLFYSEVAGFQPCLLCWWARILLYPQVVILLVALIAEKDDVRKYCASLSAMGVLLTAYHTYIQLGGAPLGNCDVAGVSCQHVYFLEYGYVTIPTMALTAFVLILLFMLSPNPKK